jgi:hypothetical protein
MTPLPTGPNNPFRRPEELAVYQALITEQLQLPCHRSLLVAANPRVRVLGRPLFPDLLVVHSGRAGVIEIDGASHYGRCAADRSRDRLLEDAGIAYIDHLDAESATQSSEVSLFVRRFLERLAG